MEDKEPDEKVKKAVDKLLEKLDLKELIFDHLYERWTWNEKYADAFIEIKPAFGIRDLVNRKELSVNDRARRYPVLQHFSKYHVSDRVEVDRICKKLDALAFEIAKTPYNPETEMALRKLLEARDCFIRSGQL